MRARACALGLAAALAGLPGGHAGAARAADGDTAGAAPPAALPPAGRYRILSRYSMPHLDEGLRAAQADEVRCVAGGDASALFPLLREPALQGCTLMPAGRADAAQAFWLRCAQAGGPTGTARLDPAPAAGVTGSLDLTLGGKNMTLTQRVAAERIGPCD